MLDYRIFWNNGYDNSFLCHGFIKSFVEFYTKKRLLDVEYVECGDHRILNEKDLKEIHTLISARDLIKDDEIISELNNLIYRY
jgi:hypothetical protein